MVCNQCGMPMNAKFKERWVCLFCLPDYMRKADTKSRKKRKVQNPKLYWAQKALKDAKWRAHQKSIPFDIELQDVLNEINELCPVFGQPFIWDSSVNVKFAPTIDRFVPELGYVKENIHVISRRANILKSERTLAEIELIIEWKVRHEEMLKVSNVEANR